MGAHGDRLPLTAAQRTRLETENKLKDMNRRRIEAGQRWDDLPYHLVLGGLDMQDRAEALFDAAEQLWNPLTAADARIVRSWSQSRVQPLPARNRQTGRCVHACFSCEGFHVAEATEVWREASCFFNSTGRISHPSPRTRVRSNSPLFLPRARLLLLTFLRCMVELYRVLERNCAVAPRERWASLSAQRAQAFSEAILVRDTHMHARSIIFPTLTCVTAQSSSLQGEGSRAHQRHASNVGLS